jgi:D-amino-acid dehydrogenase
METNQTPGRSGGRGGAHPTAAVVGAGIVGAATAYALARDGWSVTLIDGHASPGQGESRANGAQLSYSYVEPLATPDALRALPGWLLSADSPLRWRPRPEAAHLRWLAAFVAACRWSQVRRTTGALLSLSGLSRETLNRWLADQPGLGEQGLHARPGKLVVYRKAAAKAGVERQLAWQRELGCEQRLVEADECIALEPALAAGGGGPIAFGVWTASEEVIDAARLAQGLSEASGAELRFDTTVRAIERRGSAGLRLYLAGRPAGQRAGRAGSAWQPAEGTALVGQLAAGSGLTQPLAGGAIVAGPEADGAEPSGDVIEVDQLVIAAGPATEALLRPWGWAPPIEPIRGYSVTLPIIESAAAPRASVTDQGRKLVYARLGARLRVAGFAELCGPERRVDPRRIEALCQAVRETFRGACRFDDPQPWVGLRPATPSGRPLVGATRWPGVWLNAGHGALGLTLACGSAALLASVMSGQAAPIDAAPFAPER